MYTYNQLFHHKSVSKIIHVVGGSKNRPVAVLLDWHRPHRHRLKLIRDPCDFVSDAHNNNDDDTTIMVMSRCWRRSNSIRNQYEWFPFSSRIRKQCLETLFRIPVSGATW